MKNLLFIFTLLLSTSFPVLGVIYSVSNYFTIDIPSGWSVTNNLDNDGTMQITSPTGTVAGKIIKLSPSSEKTIYVEDYDALNLILKDSLLIQDFGYIDDYTASGLHFTGMSDAIYNYGPSSSGQHYLGYSVRNFSFRQSNDFILGAGTLNYTVGNYIFLDGESLLAARISVAQFGDAFEIQDMNSMISSIDSSYINSPLSDSDGDGISNFNEVIFYGSDPNQIDSNGDGINDDVITSLGGHPNWDLTATIESIRQNPSDYNLNLHSLDDIQDLRAGSTMIEIHNGQATLTMEVEESDDLGVWTNGGASTLQIPIDAEAGKKFFRFKMSE